MFAENGNAHDLFDEVRESGRVDARRKLENAARECLFVDGKLYGLCARPVVVLLASELVVYDTDQDCEETSEIERGREYVAVVTPDPEITLTAPPRFLNRDGMREVFQLEHWKKAVAKTSKKNDCNVMLDECLKRYFNGNPPIVHDVARDPELILNSRIMEEMGKALSGFSDCKLSEFQPEMLAAYSVVLMTVRDVDMEGGLDRLEDAVARLVDVAEECSLQDVVHARKFRTLLSLLAGREVASPVPISATLGR